ncbi:MAG: hypothetical protein ACREP2_01630, partial [Rhodanobacteraceae bacterium]
MDRLHKKAEAMGYTHLPIAAREKSYTYQLLIFVSCEPFALSVAKRSRRANGNVLNRGHQLGPCPSAKPINKGFDRIGTFGGSL